MQEKIESFEQNNFFLPQILSLEVQKQILKCPNHNSANSVCISSECLISGLMCLDIRCQCRRVHYKCHHILLDRVLQSIVKHQKQIPQKVKETYKTIYDMINDMIQKLSKLRTKFQRQQQYFGLRQEELFLMELINDHKIDEVNGKIISSLQKAFDIEVQINKNTKENIINDFQKKRIQFDKMCEHIQLSYLQTKGTNKNLIINKLFLDSKILKQQQEYQKYRELLSQWVSESFESSQKELDSQLLFRASQHNFSAKQFHKKCDNRKNTIAIVKNQYGKIIGGFSPKQWSSLEKKTFIADHIGRSFMFSLNLLQKYQCTNSKCSIFCDDEFGPSFGKGCDLKISDKCNQGKKSFCNFGHGYNLKINNVIKYQPDNDETQKLLTGNEKGEFNILQYQVYQIKVK